MPSSFVEVWTALGWGSVAATGLIVGALVGAFSRQSHHLIALVMSVGAGVLLAAASMELVADAIRIAGPMSAVISLLFGAAVFSSANALLARFGAAHRKRCGGCTQQPSEAQQPGSGMAIAIGTALDAVPEALVLGLALRERAIPVELLLAISIGNVPEALSSSTGMRSAGRSYRYILLLWGAIALGTAVATAGGFAASGPLGTSWPPRLQAFGAGALLAMTAETLIPEAFHNSPRYSGLLAATGFCVLLVVGAATR